MLSLKSFSDILKDNEFQCYFQEIVYVFEDLQIEGCCHYCSVLMLIMVLNNLN